MLKILSEWLASWADYREMKQDWEAVLSKLPPSASSTGTPTVRWYSSGWMPLRRRWAWIEDCPSIEVAIAESQGLLPDAGARALDFSSGVGRNSLFLLKRGLHVRSIVYPDAAGSQQWFQEKWAGHYRKKCSGAGSIDVVPGEFARYDLGGKSFDLVVCVNSLMYVSMALARSAILHWQRQTQVGGLHVITTYTIDDGYNGLPSVSEDTFVTSGRAEDDELQCLYPATEWEHLGSSLTGLSSSKDCRGRHRASSIIVARKRAQSNAG
jgi:hypothetical protein